MKGQTTAYIMGELARIGNGSAVNGLKMLKSGMPPAKVAGIAIATFGGVCLLVYGGYTSVQRIKKQ